MDYFWWKACHVAATMTWIGGLILAAVTVAALSNRDIPPDQRMAGSLLNAVQTWDRRVTSPAMFLVWALGLTLAMQGSWFQSRWLVVKLPLVFLLSAVHGVLSGRLRRLGRSPQSPPAPALRYVAPVVLGTVLVIVTLVIVKPF